MADKIVTAQKLKDADKDCDALDQAISGGDSEYVKTRRGKEYPTMPNAIRQIMENGGFMPFATEAELLAYMPNISPSAAKAMDTKKVWLWKDNGWHDTGLSELEQAKDFANANPKFKTILLTSSDNLNDVIVEGDFSAIAIAATIQNNYPFPGEASAITNRRVGNASLSQTVETLTGKIAVRTKSASWGEWDRQATATTVANDIKIFNENSPKLTTRPLGKINANDALENGVFSVLAANATPDMNFPVQENGTLFIDRAANASKTQIFLTLSNRLFTRAKSVNWNEWDEKASKAYVDKQSNQIAQSAVNQKLKMLYTVPSLDIITAKKYAVMAIAPASLDVDILLNNKGDIQEYPGSMTKLLSVLVALDFGVDLSERFNVIQDDIVVGSGYNLKAGDSVSVRDLLYDMMLPSSNIAANCVARVIGMKMGGDTQTFVDEMNVKALSLGMKSSKFYNPSGLAHGQQKTTCIDMCLLGVHASQNSILQEIWSQPSYDMTIEGPNARTESIRSSVIPITNGEFWAYGGKTGTLGSLFNMILVVHLPNGYKGVVVTMGSASSDVRALDCEHITMHSRNNYAFPSPLEIIKLN
ncbi:serine hydrolase [Acinetobacter rudis]|uniref:serine hydrolase n=1 Tax=Acinetobacter rudis TaxID=632955 RepID=UPI00280F6F2E|nr:serine hydrolase [Acinetobacter rudis]MDQ8953472.1 serine hydrolase [Acinetobacter rudis]